MEELKVRIGNGWLVATKSSDPEYPGIDVEYVADNDTGSNLSRPRVLVECPEHSKKLRALCWTNPDDEDYTDEVILSNRINATYEVWFLGYDQQDMLTDFEHLAKTFQSETEASIGVRSISRNLFADYKDVVDKARSLGVKYLAVQLEVVVETEPDCFENVDTLYYEEIEL